MYINAHLIINYVHKEKTSKNTEKWVIEQKNNDPTCSMFNKAHAVSLITHKMEVQYFTYLETWINICLAGRQFSNRNGQNARKENGKRRKRNQQTNQLSKKDTFFGLCSNNNNNRIDNNQKLEMIRNDEPLHLLSHQCCSIFETCMVFLFLFFTIYLF